MDSIVAISHESNNVIAYPSCMSVEYMFVSVHLTFFGLEMTELI